MQHAQRNGTFTNQNSNSVAKIVRVAVELPWRMMSKALIVLMAWQERARQRTSLGQMDDRMLKDIGLNRLDVYRETSRPFWKD